MPAGDICSLPGIMKLSESILIFITLMLHRHGDNGEYLFFSTTGLKLNYSDPTIDAENLGNGTLVAFMIINLVLLLSYFFDGRHEAHSTILEPIWNLLGASMFLGTATVTIITWKDETCFAFMDVVILVLISFKGRGHFLVNPVKMADTSSGITETQFYRNVTAALAMAGICVIIGVMYLVDTVVSIIYRRKYADQYENP